MMNKFGIELGEYLNFNHISIKEFAERIGTTPKNLIAIINGKVSLSSEMIYNIAFITNIPVSYIENVEKNYKLDKTIDKFIQKNNLDLKEYINKFHYQELKIAYHITYTDERNNYDILKDILKFLRISNPEIIYRKDNNILYKSKNDKPELLSLWLEECYKEVLKEAILPYNNSNIEILAKYIKDMAMKNEFDAESLIAEFNKNGIYLAIVDDLKGSKIRGAFKVLNDVPAIYITKKYHRIADIYFALLHELAHCKSDFNRAKSGSIISTFDEINNLDYEIKADNTALNWMVDNNYYNQIKNQYHNLNNLQVIKSFYVYRLAKDGIISYSSKLYQNNNSLLKQD
jgi:HTH-type transcriptional regulator/antitoxin HigA